MISRVPIWFVLNSLNAIDTVYVKLFVVMDYKSTKLFDRFLVIIDLSPNLVPFLG